MHTQMYCTYRHTSHIIFSGHGSWLESKRISPPLRSGVFSCRTNWLPSAKSGGESALPSFGRCEWLVWPVILHWGSLITGGTLTLGKPEHWRGLRTGEARTLEVLEHWVRWSTGGAWPLHEAWTRRRLENWGSQSHVDGPCLHRWKRCEIWQAFFWM